MTGYCYICNKAFKDEDEIVGVMAAYWHTVPSRVNYSITKPHQVFKDTLHHMECDDVEA